MELVIDVESNSIDPHKASKLWVVVCKEVESGKVHIFRNVHEDKLVAQKLCNLLDTADKIIGHNILDYDACVLYRLLGVDLYANLERIVDTLIVSRLVDYAGRKKHSIESYGEEFGYPKIKFSDFTKYSPEMETYCVRDVEICLRIYVRYLGVVRSPSWASALDLEHRFQIICNDIHKSGFAFNTVKADLLLQKVVGELAELDKDILESFKPKKVTIREFTPKLTKFGTISRTSVPRSLHHEIHKYESGKTYPHTRLVPFNPASHKQVIEVLNEAGWQPHDKTETHKDTERLLRRSKSLDLEAKLVVLSKYGWKINEDNLLTLPTTAPKPARSLAKRILLESRRRTLTEWLSLVEVDGRIHGRFQGIGAWTHRMAHQNPNTANIPREFKEDGTKKLLGKELRSLWIAPKKRLLVGVDAEGIQLRVFAHYINDPEFTDALVRGRKTDKSDPHSLNQRILGSKCKTRQAAKRFVYALLLGGGLGKLTQILDATRPETEEALDRLLQRYTGFAKLRKEVFPRDAKRGYFIGLDGRHVPIPGDTDRDRQHLAMSGYLQNGEAILIKRAALLGAREIRNNPELAPLWNYVDIVHDELQSEVASQDMRIALQVAEIKRKAIVDAGLYYKLKCPLEGSYWNEDHNDYTIGTNWYQTH